MSRPGRKISEAGSAVPEQVMAEINGHPEPVVFRGLCSHWPLVGVADDVSVAEQYLLSYYEGAPVTAFISEPEAEGRIFYNEDVSGLNFRQIKTRLDDVLTQIRQVSDQSPAPTIYMGSMALNHCLPGMKADNSLPAHDLKASVRIWIGNRSKIAAHYDVMDNIACVCAGKRRFTLFPPDQLPNLYVGPMELTPAGQQISLVDLDNPDPDRFPRFAEALEHAQSAKLEPGDAIYIPAMWWHHVQGLSSFNILINHWWREVPDHMGAPVDALLHAILNIRDLPPTQRQAWRGLFDHYVFNHSDAHVEHIPEHSRGVLGVLDETTVRRLRMLLRNKLNR